MIECKSREDRLYVLATVCKQKGITPNGSTYMSVIQAVCCGKFLLTKAKARELASTLTSAYKHDHWAEILGETTIEQTDIITQRPDIALPQKGKYTIKQEAKMLFQIAQKDTFNGVGRLQLTEVQYELGALTADQIIGIWQATYPNKTIEQQGSIFLIYWQGKDEVRNQRNNLAPSVPKSLVMAASKDYYVEPELEKDCEPANKPSDNIICGEVSVDDSGVVADEEDPQEV
jgi:hypothetical protein